jgi:MFS family permease
MATLSLTKNEPDGNYKWYLVGMLWCVSFFNYADRNTLAAVMPQVKAAFQLDNVMLGLLSSSFLWVYALMASPAGWLGDRIGHKRVILTGLVLWSLTTFLTPFATGFLGFVILRALTGLGEAGYYPSGTAMIGDHHGSKTRSRALSIHQTAVFAGGGIGGYIAGLMAEYSDWKMPFYVYGLLGLVLAVVLVFVLKEPQRHLQVKQSGDQTKQVSVGAVLKTRSALLLCLVFFMGTFVTVGITTWAPTFFNTELKLSLSKASAYGVVTVAVAGFLAVLCSGFLADWAVRKSAIARFYVLAGGLFLAGLAVMPFGESRNPVVLGGLLLAAGFFKGIFDGSIYAAMQDVVPPQVRATAVGLMTTIGFAGAGLAPMVIGYLSDRIGLGHAIAATGSFYVVAAVVLLASKGQIARDVKMLASQE